MIKFRLIVRAAAWLVLLAIIFVTLGSPDYRPTTSLGHDTEHALAFILLGLLFGIGYAKWRLVIVLGAVPAVGLLEALQLWAPGRHARLEDFAVNLVTFWVAFVAGAYAAGFINSRRSYHDEAGRPS